jgi:hypothetical protein
MGEGARVARKAHPGPGPFPGGDSARPASPQNGIVRGLIKVRAGFDNKRKT